MLIFILFLIFATVAFASFYVVPSIYGRASLETDKQQQKLLNNMERLLPRQEARKVSQFLIFIPLILAVAAYFFIPAPLNLWCAIVGGVIGLIIPSIYVGNLKRKTREKFDDQLVDALMIMSSSFRGGLSLVQSMEAVVEEMPNPIKTEFGILLGENKMGVSLEEALYRLYNRMSSTALQQMITAILLARETGGNLPIIFSRIVNNVRERKKIQQNIDTLTVQGKIQAAVMSLLPIAFAAIVYSTNRRLFEHMLTSEIGRFLLIYCVISWLLGVIMIIKVSNLKEY